MRPIRPARLIGGAVYAEDAPIYIGPTQLHRGVDLSSGRPMVVMVREPGEHKGPPQERFDLFERAMVDRSKMAGSPVPRLLHCFGRKGRVLAVVEEYVRGAQLADVLDALLPGGVQLPVELALALCRPLLRLWVAAESASPAIRFYLDPCRILVEPTGNVRMLPEYVEERPDSEATEALARPVAYLAPEQIQGREADARSGVYTFGVLLSEVLLGSHPLAGGGRALPDLLAEHELPSLQKRRPTLPASLAAFIDRCVARDPAQRFASFAELVQHFTAVQAQHPPTGPADIAAYLQRMAPGPMRQELPPIMDARSWEPLANSGYDEVSLPAPPAGTGA
jgi:serine/threonine-protein kinase